MPSITAVGDISELVWRSTALVSGFSVTLLLSSALVWRNGLREAWLVPLWAKGDEGSTTGRARSSGRLCALGSCGLGKNA